jgi:hypothetical protein
MRLGETTEKNNLCVPPRASFMLALDHARMHGNEPPCLLFWAFKQHFSGPFPYHVFDLDKARRAESLRGAARDTARSP